MQSKKSIAVIGSGLIGSGWAARFFLNGYRVHLYDAFKKDFDYTKRIIENARYAYQEIFDTVQLERGQIIYCNSLDECLNQVDYVQESIPENIEIKTNAYLEFEKHISKETIIASSTSGLMPSELQTALQHPERLIVAHPFNPVYLLPVVEVVQGTQTSQSTLEQTMQILSDIGMHPIHIQKEIEAFVADRLLEAIWRESLWLVKDDIATTEQIDNIVRYGFGLRYAQMGIFETYKIAGADQGMQHFLKQFGPALQWNWTKLMNVPQLDDALINKIVEQVDKQSSDLSVDELEKLRDANLISIIKALKHESSSVGVIFNQYEEKLKKQNNEVSFTKEGFMLSYQTFVKSEWVDYNNHMRDSYYSVVFSKATDALLLYLGLNEQYLQKNHSLFTAEIHLRYLAQCYHQEALSIFTQLVSYDQKRIHIVHLMKNNKNELVSTSEQMLLHVQLEPSKVVPFLEPLTSKIIDLSDRQIDLDKQEFISKSIQTLN